MHCDINGKQSSGKLPANDPSQSYCFAAESLHCTHTVQLHVLFYFFCVVEIMAVVVVVVIVVVIVVCLLSYILFTLARRIHYNVVVVAEAKWSRVACIRCLLE